MQKRQISMWMRRGLGVAAALVVAGPATAETVYSWRTEDGGYAFTDDEKSIPPRYREAVKVRKTGELAGYANLTPSDPDATLRYAERLSQRLDRLRAFNAAARQDAPGAAEEAPRSISLRTGGENSPSLDLTPGEGEEPIIVERVSGLPSGDAVTRDNLVVRQGDRTLAIVKSRRHQWNLSDDIYDEDELEQR